VKRGRHESAHDRRAARAYRYGRPRSRPKWWPANEPWPPQGPPSAHVRHLVFVRVAAAATIIFLVLVVVPFAALWFSFETADIKSPGKMAFAFAVIFVVIVLALGAVGGARRIGVPLGNLVEAAGRVEAGDYSARVEERHRGPSELRALTRAFNDMAARLQADEAQRRTLLADVGHELRTPLAVLQGQIEAMVDGIHPADEAHLTAALEEIRVLGQLVEDLRTLTLAESGSLALHREPTDLAVLAQDACAAFEGLARSAGVTLRVEMAGDLPLLDLDPIRIRQVLGNLISNALRYAPKGSLVRVVGARAGNAVAVSVVDAGPGIPPDLLPHLFERFAKSADSRGSGLGLAIARRLVEAHGGTIRAAQPEGGGTAITFELPA